MTCVCAGEVLCGFELELFVKLGGLRFGIAEQDLHRGFVTQL